jgi:hypothetical protein
MQLVISLFIRVGTPSTVYIFVLMNICAYKCHLMLSLSSSARSIFQIVVLMQLYCTYHILDMLWKNSERNIFPIDTQLLMGGRTCMHLKNCQR